ncbi:MAG: HAMP domain-containing sensor histidine kinase [Leifsonia sp.]
MTTARVATAAGTGDQKKDWWMRGPLARIRPFRSWTIRSRVVLVVVAMLAVLGAVIGTVSLLALQSTLISRLDLQLTSAVERGQRAANFAIAQNPSGPDLTGILLTPGQQPSTFGAVVSSKSVVFSAILAPRPDGGTPNSPLAPRRGAATLTDVPEVTPGRSAQTQNLGSTLGDYRLAAAQLINGDTVVVGLPMSEVNATMGQLTLVIVLVTLAGLVVAFLLANVVSRLAMLPLERVAGTAQQVAEMPLDRGDVALSVRVPVADTDSRTEVGKVGAALNRMLGHVASALSARQASELKVRQFVADASHELRTPLASIRGYAELTRRSPHELPSDVTRSLGRIESEATRMTSLVEDLLLLARLDEGRELDRDPVDLSMMLVDAIGDAHAAGPDHKWSILLPEEPVEVVGDRARLHQVVVNLLANARVHTPNGTTVTATLGLDREAERAIVRVADNGPGIPEALKETLFERFARGDSSRNRATGSTGLGLAIVHAVVEAHGGEVQVESKPGETVFTVSLPAAMVTSDVVVAEAEPSDPAIR